MNGKDHYEEAERLTMQAENCATDSPEQHQAFDLANLHIGLAMVSIKVQEVIPRSIYGWFALPKADPARD